MLIEALDKPITYRWPGGEVQLKPGCPVPLPEARALKLLAKARGKVRIAKPEAATMRLSPGIWIEYASPVFGQVACEVLEVGRDGDLCVFHPLQEKLVTIPLAWVAKVLQQAPDGL